MKILERQLANNSLSNAYIIEGDDIDKVLDLTIDFSNKIFEKNNINMSYKLNPDFHIIDKEFIDINTVRNIVKDLVIRPQNNKIKIYIIHNAGNLRAEAANAMLKSLEELKDYVIVFFTTENSQSIIPTIRSRCQIISLNLDAKVTDEDISNLSEIVAKVFKGDLSLFYKQKDFLLTYGEDKHVLLKNLTKIITDVLLYKSTGDQAKISIYSYELEELSKMNTRSIENILDKILLISRAYKTNINQEISVENIFYNIYKEGRKFE